MAEEKINPETLNKVKAYLSKMREGDNHARNYPLTEYGIWRVVGCYPDSELNDVVVSHKERKELGVLVGRFIDVLAYAVEIPGFRIRHDDEMLHEESEEPEHIKYDAKMDVGSPKAGYIKKVNPKKEWTAIPKIDGIEGLL